MTIELTQNTYSLWNHPIHHMSDIAFGTAGGVDDDKYTGFSLSLSDITFFRTDNEVWKTTEYGFILSDNVVMPSTNTTKFVIGSKVESIASLEGINSGTDLLEIGEDSLIIKQSLTVQKSYGLLPGIQFADTEIGIGLDVGDDLYISYPGEYTPVIYSFGQTLFSIPVNTSVNGNIDVLGNISCTGTTPWLEEETDPVFTNSDAFTITSTQISNWDSAYGWGDHSTEGYLTAVPSTITGNITINGTFDSTGLITGNNGLTLTAGEITMDGFSTSAGGVGITTTMLILQEAEINGNVISPSIVGAQIIQTINEDTYNIADNGFLTKSARMIDPETEYMEPSDPNNLTYHAEDDFISTFASMVFSDYIYQNQLITDYDTSPVGGMVLQASEQHSLGYLGTRLILMHTPNNTTDLTPGLVLDNFECQIPITLNHSGSYLGFYGVSPVAQQTLTGATLEDKFNSLVSILEEYGLLTSTIS